jgi:type II restriction enzyme
MDHSLAARYHSRSQVARIVTESWGAQNLFCAACEHLTVAQSPNNTRAIDYSCEGCGAAYQLKSGARWSEKRIPDAAFDAMIRAIRSDRVPNLLVMQYTPRWEVRNLLLVPSFFFTEAAIEKRKPLGPKARRAGWVGCNILLSAIAPEGKIRLVLNGALSDPTLVRAQYKRAAPFAQLKSPLRGWALAVLRMVHDIGTREFRLADIYAFEGELSRLYPGNRNIRPKIRQQLQVLRDMGLLAFLGAGHYALRANDV